MCANTRAQKCFTNEGNDVRYGLRPPALGLSHLFKPFKQQINELWINPEHLLALGDINHVRLRWSLRTGGAA